MRMKIGFLWNSCRTHWNSRNFHFYLGRGFDPMKNCTCLAAWIIFSNCLLMFFHLRLNFFSKTSSSWAIVWFFCVFLEHHGPLSGVDAEGRWIFHRKRNWNRLQDVNAEEVHAELVEKLVDANISRNSLAWSNMVAQPLGSKSRPNWSMDTPSATHNPETIHPPRLEIQMELVDADVQLIILKQYGSPRLIIQMELVDADAQLIILKQYTPQARDQDRACRYRQSEQLMALK